MNLNNKAYLWLLSYDREEYFPQKQDISKLSESELTRYKSCSNYRKKELLLGRLLLRHALGGCLGYRIASLEVIERQGLLPKVPLAEEYRLRFSISHSDSVIAVVVRGDESEGSNVIGLDIEYLQLDRRLSAAKIFCTREQLEQISKVEGIEEKRHLFYLFWTQKEACYKAYSDTNKSVNLKSIGFDLQRCSKNTDLFFSPIDIESRDVRGMYYCSVYAPGVSTLVTKHVQIANGTIDAGAEELLINWGRYFSNDTNS